MISEIRAEFRKVFTIRSTYIIFAIMFAILFFFSFYVGGWHTEKAALLDPTRMFKLTKVSIDFLAVFPALIALLLITHEYRYNLISYSLTLSNSRNKVLAAKIIVITVVSLIVTSLVAILVPLLASLGIHANHLKLAPQSFYYLDLTWRGLFYGWGYAMAGLLFGALIRNQIGAIIVLLILPGTVEGLLSIWLKNNTVYLPFSALSSMLGANTGNAGAGTITPFHALLVFLAYLVGGWLIAWYLFLKRDAS